MAYSEQLAGRLRDHLEGIAGIREQKMFGGVSFLLDGNLAVGVIGDELCVRVGPDAFDDALQQPGARVFDFSGRPMTGWVMVASDALAGEETLEGWVERGLAFAASLPPK